MLLFLYGKDEYRISSSAQKMKEKFIADRDPQGLNVHTFYAPESSLDDVLHVYTAPPFLAEKKCLFFYGFLAEAKTYESFLLNLYERMEADTMPVDTILVFVEYTDTWRTKIAKNISKKLESEPYTQRFDLLKAGQLSTWIMSEVVERGASIDSRAAQVLAQALEPDMWSIHHTIDQLIAYTKGKKIQQADVSLFLPESATDNIFALVDTIFSQKAAQSFQLLHEQYNAGSDAGYVFAMLIRQCRILLQLQSYTGPTQGAAKAVGVHPYVAKKSMALVNTISSENIRSLYHQLLVVDQGVKTGKTTYNEGLDTTLLQFMLK